MALTSVSKPMLQIIKNIYSETLWAGIRDKTKSCSCMPGRSSIWLKKNGMADKITDTTADPVSISVRCDAEAQVAFQFFIKDKDSLWFTV